MKKFIAFIFAALFATVSFADTETVDGVTYTYSISNGEATIGTGSSSAAIPWETSGALVIPSSLGGCPVTTIGDWAFFPCSLTSVTIPSSVTTIGDWAFGWCHSLTSVTIPSSVTTIGDSAFSLCSSLTSVTIPSSVTTIGDEAFFGCDSLTSVTIPEGVTTIGKGVVGGCDKLQSINVASANQTYRTINGILYTKDGLTLVAYPSAKKSVTIPEGVTTIGAGAFESCRSLTSVTIPSSVTTIGEEAFSWCSSLILLTIPSSVTTIGERAFEFCDSLTSVTIPKGVKTFGDWAFCGCDSLTSIAIPESVTTIGEGAFYLCDSLTSVTIPSSVTTIEYGAFSGCSSLTSVTIGNGVTTIGEVAFCACSSLTSVTIPESVTTIGWSAFSYCSSLTSVTIPSSVTTIDCYAFYGCSSLASVRIPSSVTTIGEWAFILCDALKYIYVDEGDTDRVKGLLRDSGLNVDKITFIEGDIPGVVVQADDQAVSWTGAAQSPQLKIVNPVKGGTLSYRTNPSAAWTTTKPSFKNPGSYTVYYKATAPKATGLVDTYGSLTFTILPAPTVIIDIDGMGSATGAGFYKMGTTVNLKASAKTGYVFAGWYEGGEPIARGTVDYRQPTYSIKIEESEIHLTARFVPKSEDLYVYAMLDVDSSGYTAGMKIDAIRLYVDSQSLPTVSATGLPAGLKFDPKTLCVSGTPSAPGEYRAKFTIKNAAGANYIYEEMIKIRNYECSLGFDYENGYTFTSGVGFSEDPVFGSVMAEEYIGWTVSGLPAGVKFDSKTGLFSGAATTPNKSYTVTFTKKVGNVVVEKGTVTMRTEAMPQTAVGTFKGVAFRELATGDSILGAFTLTASDKGALKATINSAKATYIFSATAWNSIDEERLYAKFADKAGNRLELELNMAAYWNEDQVEGTLMLATGATYKILAQANAFAVKRYYKAMPDGFGGWTLDEVETAAEGSLTLTLKSDGTASLSGKVSSIAVTTTAPIQLHRMRDGALNVHFMPIVTVEKVKRILSIEINVVMDYTDISFENVGKVMLGE